MEIRFNGQVIAINEHTRLSALLETHGLLETAIAVAINRKVVPMSEWRSVVLEPGDRVDSVQPIGAG